VKAIRDIVKDPEWQKVRTSLLGNWNTKTEWCCAQLRNWIGPLDKATVTELRILMNYLTGTGFRMGKIKHNCIQSLRTQVSMEIKKRKAKKEWV